MIYESFASPRAPIVLTTKYEDFTCEICKRAGYGPANSKVHPGKCRAAKTREISIRTAARRKRLRDRDREAAASAERVQV